jgi:hypothetical protein
MDELWKQHKEEQEWGFLLRCLCSGQSYASFFVQLLPPLGHIHDLRKRGIHVPSSFQRRSDAARRPLIHVWIWDQHPTLNVPPPKCIFCS